jgi:hypothetical protein
LMAAGRSPRENLGSRLPLRRPLGGGGQMAGGSAGHVLRGVQCAPSAGQQAGRTVPYRTVQYTTDVCAARHVLGIKSNLLAPCTNGRQNARICHDTPSRSWTMSWPTHRFGLHEAFSAKSTLLRPMRGVYIRLQPGANDGAFALSCFIGTTFPAGL